MTVRVLLTLVPTVGVLCRFNWAYKYLAYLQEIYPQANPIKTVGGKMGFFVGNQESRDPTRAIITPIWIGGRFRSVIARLVGGCAELL